MRTVNDFAGKTDNERIEEAIRNRNGDIVVIPQATTGAGGTSNTKKETGATPVSTKCYSLSSGASATSSGSGLSRLL